MEYGTAVGHKHRHTIRKSYVTSSKFTVSLFLEKIRKIKVSRDRNARIMKLCFEICSELHIHNEFTKGFSLYSFPITFDLQEQHYSVY